jgi:molybdate transport system substrate-binding protein
MKKILLPFILLLATLHAGEIKIAVAANVTPAMEPLKKAFAKTHPNTDVTVILGSSGQLTAQIQNGAPFDVFLSADMSYPQSLYEKNIAQNQPQLYAQGALVLFSARRIDLTKGIESVMDNRVNTIAIADPKTAPYGKAAVEALTKVGLLHSVENKFVYGTSINQAVQFTLTAAQIGFVAKSSMKSNDMLRFQEGKDYIDIDPSLYAPINQGIVILAHGKENAEAKAFYDFMLSNDAKNIMKQFGYLVP